MKVEIARPSHIKVGLHTYDVLWSKESWKKYALAEFEAGAHVGLTLHRLTKILVQGWDMSISAQAEVLQHEVFHACLDTLGFADMPITTGSNFDTEETLIRLLSPTYLQVLQENPDLVEYLTNA